MRLLRLFSLTLAGTLNACGGSTPPEDPSSVAADPVNEASSDGAEDGASAEASPSWKDMNRDQRMEFMGLTVMPKMKELFQAYDPKGFAEFKCQTCHGEDMKEVDYRMPNGLFALAAPDPIPGAKEYDAKVTTFMMEQVTPEMAKVLGLEPGKELNCFSCHDTEK